MIRLLLNILLLTLVLSAIDKDLMSSVPVPLPPRRATPQTSSNASGRATSTPPPHHADCTTSSSSPPATTGPTPQSPSGSTEDPAAPPSSVCLDPFRIPAGNRTLLPVGRSPIQGGRQADPESLLLAHPVPPALHRIPGRRGLLHQH